MDNNTNGVVFNEIPIEAIPIESYELYIDRRGKFVKYCTDTNCKYCDSDFQNCLCLNQRNNPKCQYCGSINKYGICSYLHDGNKCQYCGALTVCGKCPRHWYLESN